MAKNKARKRSFDVLNDFDSKAAYNKSLEYEFEHGVYVNEKMGAFIKVNVENIDSVLNYFFVRRRPPALL